MTTSPASVFKSVQYPLEQTISVDLIISGWDPRALGWIIGTGFEVKCVEKVKEYFDSDYGCDNRLYW